MMSFSKFLAKYLRINSKTNNPVSEELQKKIFVNRARMSKNYAKTSHRLPAKCISSIIELNF